MPETTFEETKRCPKCGHPGEDTGSRPVPGMKGVKVHTIYCRTELCPWYNTCWLVQVNLDGTVPPPSDHRGEPKVYVGFERHEQAARDIRAAVAADKAAQTRPGSEIRRRDD